MKKKLDCNQQASAAWKGDMINPRQPPVSDKRTNTRTSTSSEALACNDSKTVSSKQQVMNDKLCPAKSVLVEGWADRSARQS